MWYSRYFISSLLFDDMPDDSSLQTSRWTCEVQVKRFELLLNKCKETIRVNKEKVQQLTNELEKAEKQLQIKTREFESLQVLDLCGSVVK